MTTLSARNFLIHGMLAGIVAGLLAFGVAYAVGEPHVQTAIELEETNAAAEVGAHGKSVSMHGGDHEVEVSRHHQRTWGLLTATVATGVGLGGLVGLVSAALVGRIGRLRPSQTVGLVSLLGFVSVSLVPFMKYPATPPAVGNAETIGHRTSVYFGFLVVSVVAAVIAVAVSRVLLATRGTYVAILAGVGVYVILVVAAAQWFAPVNEIGDFPADVLWYFRLGSLMTITTMWASIGIVLAGLVGYATAQSETIKSRRELAASL